MAQQAAVYERQSSFDIAAQSLAGALAAFGRQSGLHVSSDAAVTQGRSVTGVSGSLTAAEALDRLLAGSGLAWRVAGAGTVIVYDMTGADAAIADDGSLLLDTIVIASEGRMGHMGTPERVYEAAESVSVISRDAIGIAPARDARDLLSLVPGVYSGEGNGSFPTVSPNIRGLQDSGRVVVSIDGARQNAQRGLGSGSGGYQSNAGQAYVDSAFIRTVEIDKDPDASLGSAASLAGTVNFRTIGAEDLIDAGSNWGVELNATGGDNEYDFRGSVLASSRLGDSPLSLTAGFSRFKLGEYEIGHNGEEPASTEHFKGRDSWSTFLKLEGDFADLQSSLSWMHQENGFKYGSDTYTNRETAYNDSVTAKLAWNPESELVDLGGNLWLNNSLTKEVRASREAVGGPPVTNVDLGLLTFGGSVENTSRLDTKAGGLTFNYGLEAFHDDATASATSSTIEENPGFASSYIAFSPPGKRDIASGFVNAKWEPKDWIGVSAGLRYDWYRLHGSPTYYHREEESIDTSRVAAAVTTWGAWAQVNRPADYAETTDHCAGIGLPPLPPPVQALVQAEACNQLARPGEPDGGAWYNEGQWISGTVENVITFPSHTADIDRSGGAWLPSATLELRPVDWFHPYVSYSQSYRPATVTEAFLSGGPPGDSVGTNYAPNVHLRPERARTFEIGANVTVDGLLHDDDRLRMKVAAFQRDIDDYVVIGDVLADDVSDVVYLGFVNVDGTTRMRGVELEGTYDAGRFWVGGAFTWLTTEWPQSTEVFSNGTTTTSGDIFATAGNVPPKLKVLVDGGVRLFDESLSVGARVSHVTPTLSRELDTEGNLVERTEPYTTLDLYGSYRFSDAAMLRVAVTNVTDINYVPASGSYSAPGRTFTASLKMKF